jgi:hypothetical protein
MVGTLKGVVMEAENICDLSLDAELGKEGAGQTIDTDQSSSCVFGPGDVDLQFLFSFNTEFDKFSDRTIVRSERRQGAALLVQDWDFVWHVHVSMRQCPKP